MITSTRQRGQIQKARKQREEGLLNPESRKERQEIIHYHTKWQALRIQQSKAWGCLHQ